MILNELGVGVYIVWFNPRDEREDDWYTGVIKFQQG